MKNLLLNLFTFLFCALSLSVNAQNKKQRYYHLLVGTYTRTQNQGIFVYEFDSKTGKLKLEHTTEGIKNPSYLTINKEGTKVYSVSEQETSGVSYFQFNNKTGQISYQNFQPSPSPGGCYISLTNDDKYVFTANYGGGSVSVFPVKANGEVAPINQLIQHEGTSINERRQNKPHAHCIYPSVDGSHYYVPDLGADKVFAYQYQADANKPLIPAKQPSIAITPGGGPRHFIFNKKGTFAYLVEELTAHVSVYSHQNQELKQVQRISMNTPDFKGTNGAADIHLSQDGNYLYASNRGTANEIVIFKVDKTNGTLTKIDNVSCKGKTPRNFSIDPSNNFLLVANQDSNDIFVFKRDTKTGLLIYTGETVNVGAPVCLKFTPKL
ncbi:lactonase family protein [Pedobacter glucosidilyticus]|uniref:lactonase family protein n=1 Tax=Pedobacter glucosidilyticus TaxID=1122941 RepID=UPI0026F204B7|nr:lactonase family protein [Pedobacter glucosidilyticus]